VLRLCALPACLLTSLAGPAWLQQACKACQERRKQWWGATTKAKFDARKVSKERGWERGELEMEGGREGIVE
jgi:hypothetical protein